jgi:molybdate transport system ATP-binding protein
MLLVDIKKKIYSDGQIAFNLDVAFKVYTGITILFGPSGSGKTTTLRTITGIVMPDEGRIVFGDQIYFDSSLKINVPIQKRKIGYVFQDYALFPHLTAEENVAYGIQVKGKKEKYEKAFDNLKLLGIEHTRKRYPRELSGGEKQRVALARVLAFDPKIMLLDEPLSAVDLNTRSQLLEQITDIHQKAGIPIIYITHNPIEALHIGHHVVALNDGKVIKEGDPNQVIRVF